MRVLNTLRLLGITVTASEYLALGGLSFVVSALSSVRKFTLAETVTSYLPCGRSLKLKAVEARCKAMISASTNANETTQQIITLLKSRNSGQLLPAQFSRLSAHAHRLGNRSLASCLARCEVDSVERSHACLLMGDGQGASRAASLSRNPSLLAAVLTAVEKEGTREAFIKRLVEDLPGEAFRWKKREWRVNDRRAFMGLVLAAGKSAEAAQVRGWR